MNHLVSWEDYKHEYSKDAIVSYDIHYKKLRYSVRELLKDQYGAVMISKSTYLLEKLKKRDLTKLDLKIKMLFQANQTMSESTNNKKSVRILILLPANEENTFLQFDVVDQVIEDSIEE